ncbi:hypothetical protein ACIQXU_16380 [Peribacillus sp. NPDC097284]
MEKTIQEAAKEKVIGLLADYDVAYIDYDAREDDYTIRIEKKKTNEDE